MVEPRKRIYSDSELHLFRKSDTYRSFISFLRHLSQSIEGVPTDKCRDEFLKTKESMGQGIGTDESVSGDESPPLSSVMSQLGHTSLYCVGYICKMLDKIGIMTNLHAPLEQKMRFGNKAFQNLYDDIANRSPKWILELINHFTKYPPDDPTANTHALELGMHFVESFGSRTRIDFGTGHELNFLIFLFDIFKMGGFNDERLGCSENNIPDDYFEFHDITVIQYLVLVVFDKYLRLVRRLQCRYVMEPAGSRGVWGLDDFHFMPFYFGSGQLMGHEHILPSHSSSSDVVHRYKSSYMYMDAIANILEVKKGVSFAECSPMLNDISAVPNWSKVNGGFLKMYDVEVLSKLPIMQHVTFGTLFQF